MLTSKSKNLAFKPLLRSIALKLYEVNTVFESGALLFSIRISAKDGIRLFLIS
jgi:hypothetical protein